MEPREMIETLERLGFVAKTSVGALHLACRQAGEYPHVQRNRSLLA